jgi:SAM-dependent methyltransferase
MQPAREAYDAVAYPAFPYPDTHPNRLAVMATLHGLSPAPVEHCRVLEIACNEGANLIPMAYAIPHSEFVGFDVARKPIERGQERIRQLGLTNVRIFAADLLEAVPHPGRFDYIIAHGLYSWVPEPVRDRLMALCNELLAPNGVTFISYNTLPGGHLRKMLRDMMLFRVRDMEDPEQQVTEATRFLHLLNDARPENDIYRAVIEDQLKRMEARRPGATYHDELSEAYEPLYFDDFVGHAQRHGLQYLSEAVLPPPPDPCYRFDVRSALVGEVGESLIRQEQMLDFLRIRMYRETLLCRADRVAQHEFAPENLRRLQFASQAVSVQDEGSSAPVFKLPGGIKMESNHPAVNVLLKDLEKAWPHAIAYDDLEPRLKKVGFSLDADGTALVTRLAVAKMIEFRTWRAPLASGISDRPKASACSRQEGQARSYATTLLHSTIDLDDPKAKAFLRLLDGTRNRSELTAAMKAEFPEESKEEIESRIEPVLQMFYTAGVLEA